jgi:hypothetical protein
MMKGLRGSDLGIVGIVILGSMALLLAFMTILISGDAEVVKAALSIGGVAAAAVSGLVGYIGGYHQGQREGAEKAPNKPRASIEGGN